MIDEMLINQLPAPTWNRLRMNDTKLADIELPQDICEPRVSLQGSVCLNKNKNTGCCGCSEHALCSVHGSNFAKMPTGMGEAMDKLGDGQTLRLIADAGKSTASVTLRYEDGKNCFNRLEIEAKAGSELTVFMTYISTAQAAGQASVQTKIAAAAGASVKLVQVQLLGQSYVQLNDVGCELGDNAAFELLQLQLGSQRIYNGVRTELIGEAADFNAAIGYYGRQEQTIDMNFIANHYGKKTTCEMTADGVLQGGAKKIYRGTIDFKNG